MLRHAKLGVDLPLLFVHPSRTGALTDVQVRLEDLTGTVLDTIDATEVVGLAGVYQADEDWSPLTAAQYVAIWTSVADGMSVVDEIRVHNAPVGDIGAGVARYYQRDYDDAGETCQLVIYDSDINVKHTVALTEVATIAGTYRSSAAVTIEDEGVHLLVWKKNGVVDAVEVIYAGEQRGQRNVRVYAREVVGTAVSGTTPVEVLASCDVLVSFTDGTPVEQVTTDGDGRADFVLEEGVTHVVTLRKTGKVFSTNNVTYVPVDPDEDALGVQGNYWHLLTESFTPTFDPVSPLGLANLSLMTVKIVDLTGTPIQGARVLIDNLFSPFSITVSGEVYGVAGSRVTIVTDANGEAEVYLIRGQEVAASIVGTDISREFTVPDSATFSMMSQIVGSDDPFTIADPSLPTYDPRA